MAYKVHILQSAKLDLKDIKSYVVKDFGVEVWNDKYSNIKKIVSQIEQNPFAGSVPDELRNLDMPQYFQRLSGMSRIIYEVRNEDIYIHLFVDQRRDLTEVLYKRLIRKI